MKLFGFLKRGRRKITKPSVHAAIFSPREVVPSGFTVRRVEVNDDMIEIPDADPATADRIEDLEAEVAELNRRAAVDKDQIEEDQEQITQLLEKQRSPLGTIELRILDLDAANHLFAAAEQKIAVLKQTVGAGIDMSVVLRIFEEVISNEETHIKKRILGMVSNDCERFGIHYFASVRPKFNDLVDECAELTTEPDTV